MSSSENSSMTADRLYTTSLLASTELPLHNTNRKAHRRPNGFHLVLDKDTQLSAIFASWFSDLRTIERCWRNQRASCLPEANTLEESPRDPRQEVNPTPKAGS